MGFEKLSRLRCVRSNLVLVELDDTYATLVGTMYVDIEELVHLAKIDQFGQKMYRRVNA